LTVWPSNGAACPLWTVRQLLAQNCLFRCRRMCGGSWCYDTRTDPSVAARGRLAVRNVGPLVRENKKLVKAARYRLFCSRIFQRGPEYATQDDIPTSRATKQSERMPDLTAGHLYTCIILSYHTRLVISCRPKLAIFVIGGVLSQV
jgi:hypothetical protein